MPNAKQPIGRYALAAMAVALVAFLLWYFASIVTYVLVAAVLSLMGKPIVRWLSALHVNKWLIPKWLAAAVALAVIGSIFFAFFRLFIPLIVRQFNELRTIDVHALLDSYAYQIDAVQRWVQGYLPHSTGDFELRTYLTDLISGIFSVSMLTGLFSSTANLILNTVITLFAIAFITYFFLKDEDLFYNGLMLFIPSRWEQQMSRALSSIDTLLRRYFVGILCESLCITLLNTIWLSIIGITFETAIVIGFIAGVVNVVPYVGPVVGTAVGLLIGWATNFAMPHDALLSTLIWVFVAMCATQLIDNLLLQPLIYGNSVKAHPLEIFLVLLVAGSVAGILGMLLAIPTYTVIRVFAKEFFNNFKVVKKLTERI